MKALLKQVNIWLENEILIFLNDILSFSNFAFNSFLKKLDSYTTFLGKMII